jgi:hypothetical protein
VRLLAPLALALALVPAAAAKGPDSAVVVGPGKIALVEPYAGKVEQALGRLAPAELPAEPFALVYVVRRYVPREPARWFPRSGLLCDAASRCADAPELRGWLGTGRLTGLYRGAPLRIVSLTRDGRALPANGALAHAIELGLGQASSSAKAAPPRECFPLRARWSGSHASTRPTAFCVGMNGGVYVGGRVYPLYSGIAARLIH